ncbi:MAG: glycosyltransferase family 4 protein [Luteimonas sp.]
MHIAHLILTRRFAGSERYAVELAAAQAAAGHKVTVVVSAAGAEDRPDAIARRLPEGVGLVVVPDWLSTWHARRALGRIRPDVAHAHLSAGCKALRGLQGKMLRVATLHIRYKQQQHAHLDGLIAIAPWQLRDIPTHLREHTVQVDNWTRHVAPDPCAAQALREAHGISPDACLFGALGRVERGKGLDLLVTAFRKAAIPNARLAIVGQGTAWDAVRGAAPPDVLMPGFVSEPSTWLAAFDVFVSAARSEPFGLVLLEAMETGVPIVATASEGALHLRSMICTPLVPIDDVDAMANALRRIAAQGRARRVYDLDGFRLENKLESFDSFYRSTASAARIELRP